MADTALASSDYAIEVNDVSMVFNMASESLTNLKEYFIKIMHHELFFKEFRALKHISFKVGRGEVVGLVGTQRLRQGPPCSKSSPACSSPARHLHGARATSPRSSSSARALTQSSPRARTSNLNGSLLGYTKTFIDDHLQDIIDFAELENFMDMPLKNFSSGMVARIAFAIATITEPDILIVDETLSVGDVFFQEKCERRIQHFIESGDVTVLFVSHSIEQVKRICQRAVWIEERRPAHGRSR